MLYSSLTFSSVMQLPHALQQFDTLCDLVIWHCHCFKHSMMYGVVTSKICKMGNSKLIVVPHHHFVLAMALSFVIYNCRSHYLEVSPVHTHSRLWQVIQSHKLQVNGPDTVVLRDGQCSQCSVKCATCSSYLPLVHQKLYVVYPDAWHLIVITTTTKIRKRYYLLKET